MSPFILHGGPTLVLLGLILALWQVDRLITQTQLQMHTQEAEILTEQSARHMEDFFRSRFQIVHHLSHEWDDQLSSDENAFIDESLQLQGMFSGFQAINWVDRDGTIRWVTPKEKNLGMIGKSILSVKAAAPVFNKVKNTNEALVTPPVNLLQGFVGVVGYFPVERVGEFDGVVTAVFNTSVIIEDALGGSVGQNYVFTVFSGDKEVYRSPGETAGALFSVTNDLAIWDQTWTLRITPISASQHILGLSTAVKSLFFGLAVLISVLCWLYLKRLSDLILASSAKSEFLANMSHELRTPLNSVIGYGEMMEYQVKGPLPEGYKEYAALITTSGRLLLETINSILDIAKIEAGNFELHKTPTDLADTLDEVLSILHIQAQEKGLEISNETSELPRLNIDAMRIKQVLLNIVGNAIKFSDSGNIVIGNSTDHGMCVLSITDNGIGMTPMQVDIALKPFSQVHGSSMARRYQGAGLGLSLSRQMMILHDGDLAIASTPDQGTTVTLSFPMDGDKTRA